MRRRPRTALAVALAAVAAVVALPAGAGAKGIPALSVCGSNGCHAVDPAAVRAGFEAFSDAPTPDGAEPFFTIRARGASDVADASSLDWLPGAGVTRPYGERLWTRPAPVLDAALRRAARGLEAHPAAALGPVAAAPAARVVEVYAPAATPTATETAGAQGIPPGSALAALAAAALVAAAALAARRRTRPAAATRQTRP